MTTIDIDIKDIVRRIAEARELIDYFEYGRWQQLLAQWKDEVLEIWKPALSGRHKPSTFWPLDYWHYELDLNECEDLDPDNPQIPLLAENRGDWHGIKFPMAFLTDHERWQQEERAKVERHLERIRKQEEQRSAERRQRELAQYERLRAKFESA